MTLSIKARPVLSPFGLHQYDKLRVEIDTDRVDAAIVTAVSDLDDPTSVIGDSEPQLRPIVGEQPGQVGSVVEFVQPLLGITDRSEVRLNLVDVELAQALPVVRRAAPT